MSQAPFLLNPANSDFLTGVASTPRIASRSVVIVMLLGALTLGGLILLMVFLYLNNTLQENQASLDFLYLFLLVDVLALGAAALYFWLRYNRERRAAHHGTRIDGVIVRAQLRQRRRPDSGWLEITYEFTSPTTLQRVVGKQAAAANPEQMATLPQAGTTVIVLYAADNAHVIL